MLIEEIKHTKGHRNCPGCLAQNRTTRQNINPALPFHAAARQYVDWRRIHGKARYLSDRALRDLEDYILPLGRFFCDEAMPIAEITAGHIKEYQRQRTAGQLGRGCEVGAAKVNKEVQILKRILRCAGLWTAEMHASYQPLLESEPDIPRALAPDEQDHFVAIAGGIETCQFAFWCILLALGTTMSTNEWRKLQLGDINLRDGIVQVRSASAKTKYRLRTIALHDEALWALQRLVERAHSLGACQAQHYLMPFRRDDHVYDPARAMSVSGLKKQWAMIRREAAQTWKAERGEDHDPFRVFTPYGLRHCAITRFAEAGTPIAVIMSMAGHMSRKMQQHYTAVSEQAQRRWVEHSQNHATRNPAAAARPPRWTPAAPPGSVIYKSHQVDASSKKTPARETRISPPAETKKPGVLLFVVPPKNIC